MLRNYAEAKLLQDFRKLSADCAEIISLFVASLAERADEKQEKTKSKGDVMARRPTGASRVSKLLLQNTILKTRGR